MTIMKITVTTTRIILKRITHVAARIVVTATATVKTPVLPKIIPPPAPPLTTSAAPTTTAAVEPPAPVEHAIPLQTVFAIKLPDLAIAAPAHTQRRAPAPVVDQAKPAIAQEAALRAEVPDSLVVVPLVTLAYAALVSVVASAQPMTAVRMAAPMMDRLPSAMQPTKPITSAAVPATAWRRKT